MTSDVRLTAFPVFQVIPWPVPNLENRSSLKADYRFPLFSSQPGSATSIAMRFIFSGFTTFNCFHSFPFEAKCSLNLAISPFF